MISRPTVLSAALMALALLAGCGGNNTPTVTSNPSPPSPPKAVETGKTVGVALASMNHNFFIGMRQGVEEELAAQGMKAEIVVADDNSTNQQQQVDQLIQKGVAAIIMVPVDATQAVNPVKAANAAKIPVFCIDRRITDTSAQVTATIETDNVAMGKMAAEHGLVLLCKRRKLDWTNPTDLKKLNTTVVHLWGMEAASSAQDRAKGFEEVFNAKDTPGVKLIKAVGDFNAKKSQEIVAPLLTASPEIEFIFCHNDDNAVGALNAVKDVKKGREKVDDPKRIFIVGMDGNKAAIEAIRAGEIEATVSQEPIEMGSETVKQVKKVLDGETPDKQYIPIRHHLITREEAEELQDKLWSDLLKGGV